MTTMHTRHRRLLSMDRRGGIQLPADVADGRVARYAQGWRDINDAQEQLHASESILHALILGLCVWTVIGLAVVGAVAILG